MENWATQELQHADLGDIRRNKRLIRIVQDLASKPTSSVPQACGNIAATTAADDFWSSPYFQADDIRKPHIASTIKRIKEHDVVLAIQDTTNIDLTDHPATSGIGYLHHRKSQGLKVPLKFLGKVVSDRLENCRIHIVLLLSSIHRLHCSIILSLTYLQQC